MDGTLFDAELGAAGQARRREVFIVLRDTRTASWPSRDPRERGAVPDASRERAEAIVVFDVDLGVSSSATRTPAVFR